MLINIDIKLIYIENCFNKNQFSALLNQIYTKLEGGRERV